MFLSVTWCDARRRTHRRHQFPPFRVVHDRAESFTSDASASSLDVRQCSGKHAVMIPGASSLLRELRLSHGFILPTAPICRIFDTPYATSVEQCFLFVTRCLNCQSSTATAGVTLETATAPTRLHPRAAQTRSTRRDNWWAWVAADDAGKRTARCETPGSGRPAE